MNKKTKSRSKKVFTCIGMTLCLIALLTISFSVSLYYSCRQQIAEAKQEVTDKLAGIDENTFKKASPTIVYDKNDKEINRLSANDYIYTNYDDIPDLIKDAFIATEDKSFFKNNGISIKGIGRALVVDLKNKGKLPQGGSTITQQLVKNVLLTQDKTWERKYTEILISLQLDKTYTKEQILEYYLNNIYFGNGDYSVGTAAYTYFNKSLNQLNLAETAFIAAIPNNPSYYDPLKHYDNVIDRQHLILYNLKQQNYITQEQYDEALNTKVVLDYHPHQNPSDNYMTSYAVDCAVRALMQKNGFEFRYQFTSNQDQKDYENSYKEMYEDYDRRIRSGGYNIYTSFDVDKEKQLQASLDNGLSDFTDIDTKSGLYKMQGAAVCVDNTTGEVIAAVGGRSQSNITNSFNRAFLAVRQPGSSIKPILVYAPAFDKGYTPDDIINDQYIPNGPKNAENTFFGPVSLRYATEMSLNTVAYQLLIQEGVQYAIPYLYKMDFAHIVKQDNNPIIAVGGFTEGVTPVEMAGGYSTLARGGEFIQPTCIRNIKGNEGELLYENPKTKTRVYKEESAYNMTDVLKGVLTKSWGTGYGLGLDNITAAGKTGTTNDCKDGWFAGYTPYMTTVVWVGYDNPTATASLYGATYPGHIWQNFMNVTHEGLEGKDFDVPQSIQDETKTEDETDGQTLLNNAENAVSAYENVHINSKADYDAVTAALENAENAIDKVQADKKQEFQNRISAKSDELSKEKQNFESANQSTLSHEQTNDNTTTPSTN